MLMMALEIEIELALPFLLRELDGAAHFGVTDVVVQDVDALEGGHRGVDRGFDAVVGRRIAREGDRLSALLSDDPDRLLGRREIDIDAGGLGAMPGIGHGRRLAVAPARPDGTGAEHECGTILQSLAHPEPSLRMVTA
jgi:hypothetical protein